MTKVSVFEDTYKVNQVDDTYVVVKGNNDGTKVVVSDLGLQGARGSQILSGDTDPSIVIGLIGDQYINTTTGTIFGPKTESGWGTGVVLGTGLTVADVAFTHYQVSLSSVWTITHPLGFSPNIIVVDLNGNDIHGDYQYNGNTIVATFSEPTAGAAYLS